MGVVYILFIIGIITLCTKSLEVVKPEKISGVYYHIEGHFGPRPKDSLPSAYSYDVVLAAPDLGACSPLSPNKLKDKVALIIRGASIINDTTINPDQRCRFTTKVSYAEQAGAIAVIIGNNVGNHDIVPMFQDNYDYPEINIPSISVSHDTFQILKNQINFKDDSVKVRINDRGLIDDDGYNSQIERWITAILSTLMLLASVSIMIAGLLTLRIFIVRLKEIWRARQRRLRIDSIPIIKYSSHFIIAQDKLINYDKNINEQKEEEEEQDNTPKDRVIATDINFEENQNLINEEQIKLMETPLINPNNNNTETIGQNEVNDEESYMLHNETCHVCLEDFNEGEAIKLLRCKHGFHNKCIKFWIVKRGKCPVCIRDVFTDDRNEQDSQSFSLYI